MQNIPAILLDSPASGFRRPARKHAGRHRIFLLLALLIPPAVQAQNNPMLRLNPASIALYRQAEPLDKAGDNAGVIAVWRARTEAGDDLGQFETGVVLLRSPATSPEAARGLDLIRKSAESGYVRAQMRMYFLYRHGLPPLVNQDTAQAVAWLRRAADQNFPGALVHLGLAHESGYGVERNPKESFALFQRAAGQNSPFGHFALGAAYESGIGVAVDIERARAAYGKAIEQATFLETRPNRPYIFSSNYNQWISDSKAALAGLDRPAVAAAPVLAQAQAPTPAPAVDEERRRLEAEQGRIAEERRRIEGESAKLAAERRKAAEEAGQRLAAEKKQAEETRLTEGRRLEAERAKLAEERRRLEAENARLAAEAERQKAAGRKQEEEARLVEERRRLEAERAKFAEERQRQEAENARLAEEDRRRAVERRQAEEMRLAEERRKMEEGQARIAEERRRVEAETARIADERRRFEAETARMAEERQRMVSDESRARPAEVAYAPAPAPARAAAREDGENDLASNFGRFARGLATVVQVVSGVRSAAQGMRTGMRTGNESSVTQGLESMMSALGLSGGGSAGSMGGGNMGAMGGMAPGGGASPGYPSGGSGWGGAPQAGAPAGGRGGYSGDCDSAARQFDADFGAIAQQKSQEAQRSGSIVRQTQLLMYILDTQIQALQNVCRGRPELASLEKTFAGAKNACRGTASNPSECVPRP